MNFAWSYSFTLPILGDVSSIGVNWNISAEVNRTMKAYTIFKKLFQDIKLNSLTLEIMDLNEREPNKTSQMFKRDVSDFYL